MVPTREEKDVGPCRAVHMKCLLVEGRGRLVPHHHLVMALQLLRTQMVHGWKRTLVWGWERRTKGGGLLKEPVTSQLSIKKAKWRGERRQLLGYFLTLVPLPSPHLDYSNYIQTPRNGGIRFLRRFHEISISLAC